jgi:hypothetical protein
LEVSKGKYFLTDPISKIVKWTGGMAQKVEHMLCKHKVLNLNLSSAKKKKKKNQCAQAVKEAEAGKPIGKGGEEAIAQRPGG